MLGSGLYVPEPLLVAQRQPAEVCYVIYWKCTAERPG